MLKIKELIVVEGKYDKIKLSQIVDGNIWVLGGFKIFKDSKQKAILRKVAAKKGLIIFTDSDGAGFVIRNYLKGLIPKEQIKQAYIPQIEGKEKRKDKSSKEGLLGLEGMNREIILEALKKCGATIDGEESLETREKIAKYDLYTWGLSGKAESKQKRLLLEKHLDFPSYLSANALLEVLNNLYTKEEFQKLLLEMNFLN